MWLYDSLARYPHSSVMGQVQNTWSPLSVSGENMKGSSLSTAVYWNMGYLKPRINEYCCFWVILSQVVMELCGHRLRFASWSNISPVPNIIELGKSGSVSAGTFSKLERFTGNDRDWIVMCHNIFSERTPMASQWVAKCTSCRGNGCNVLGRRNYKASGEGEITRLWWKRPNTKTRVAQINIACPIMLTEITWGAEGVRDGPVWCCSVHPQPQADKKDAKWKSLWISKSTQQNTWQQWNWRHVVRKW